MIMMLVNEFSDKNNIDLNDRSHALEHPPARPRSARVLGNCARHLCSAVRWRWRCVGVALALGVLGESLGP